MRGLPQLQESYFEKFKGKSVKIVPYDLRTKEVAKKYIEKLRKWLKGMKVEFLHRGSTAYRIAGKGDIEIGVYSDDEDWEEVLDRLKRHLGKVGNLEENYARFNDEVAGYEIEVIMMKGRVAEVDRKVHKFLMGNRKLLKEYEQLKRKYTYSKKEYMIEKDRWLRQVVEMIPE